MEDAPRRPRLRRAHRRLRGGLGGVRGARRARSACSRSASPTGSSPGGTPAAWSAASRTRTPLEKRDDPELYRLIENVSIAAGLPATPPIYLVDDPAPNAFAAGSRPSTVYVGVTSGLRKLMPARELEAVLAHEISHIRNKDVRLMTLAAVLVGVIAILSDLAFRMAFFGGRGGRDRNPIQLDRRDRRARARAARRRAPADGAEPAARVPRRRERGRDPQRPRGDGARAPPAAARHERGRLRRPRHRAPLHREPDARDPRQPARFLAGLFQTHPPLEDRGSRRSRRRAASGSIPPRPPADASRRCKNRLENRSRSRRGHGRQGGLHERGVGGAAEGRDRRGHARLGRAPRLHRQLRRGEGDRDGPRPPHRESASQLVRELAGVPRHRLRRSSPRRRRCRKARSTRSRPPSRR